MASLDVIRRITLRAEAEGFEDAARKLQSLGRAEEGLVATSERTERATGRVEQSFRRIEGASIRQPGHSNSSSARKGPSRRHKRKGSPHKLAQTSLSALAESRVIAAATATERFAEAHKGLSAQSQAALHSIRSVAEQVALGISPVQALTGQMNHLSFAATGEGGLKGAFAGLGPVLTGALAVYQSCHGWPYRSCGGSACRQSRAGSAARGARCHDERDRPVRANDGWRCYGDCNRTAGNGLAFGQARRPCLLLHGRGLRATTLSSAASDSLQQLCSDSRWGVCRCSEGPSLACCGASKRH
jgi:hypothetical protein